MKKILIIEDDLVAGTVYKRFLQMQGFTVEVASDGAEGLERLHTFAPDAVILDLMIPKVSGIQVLKMIRTQEVFCELPVIVVTNACVPAFILEAVRAGASDIFDKGKDSPVVVLGKLQTLWEAAWAKRMAAAN